MENCKSNKALIELNQLGIALKVDGESREILHTKDYLNSGVPNLTDVFGTLTHSLILAQFEIEDVKRVTRKRTPEDAFEEIVEFFTAVQKVYSAFTAGCLHHNLILDACGELGSIVYDYLYTSVSVLNEQVATLIIYFDRFITKIGLNMWHIMSTKLDICSKIYEGPTVDYHDFKAFMQDAAGLNLL